MKDIFFSVGIFFRNVFPCKEFFRPNVCRKFFSEITHTPLPPQVSNGRPLMKAYSLPFMLKIIFREGFTWDILWLLH